MRNDDLINSIAVIAEPIRIQILSLIAEAGELRAKDILPKFDITQPTLSHHMAILEDNDLVLSRKEGRCIYYSINRKTFADINVFFNDLLSGKAVGKSGEKAAGDNNDKKNSVKKTEKAAAKKTSDKKTPSKHAASDVKSQDKKKKDKKKKIKKKKK